MEKWDPIGVKNSPEAADEYDGYRARIMQLLREEASPARIADFLDAAVQGMGLNPRRDSDLVVAELLVRWYPDSIARWKPGRSAP